MSRSTFYTITEENQNRNYIVKDGGSLLDVARLLYRMESIRGRLPKGSRISVLEAMNKNYDFLPIGTNSSRLLQPLQMDECAEAGKKIRSGESQDVFIIIDFDLDSAEILYNNKEGTIRIKAPTTTLAEVYAGALRKKNGYQYYINKEHFTTQLTAISEIQLLEHQPEQTEQEPKINI